MGNICKRYIFAIISLSTVLICLSVHPALLSAEQKNPYLPRQLEQERGEVFNEGKTTSENKQDVKIKRNSFIESERGANKKRNANFYFSDLYFDLGNVVSEETAVDSKNRPVRSSQVINDTSNPDISQQRLLSSIEYNEIDKPVRYKEQIFITAKDYLSDSIVRLFSTTDVYEVKYNEEQKAVNILGNTEVVISDDKGNSLIDIKGSFTKKARTDTNGKIVRYDRYGIDNIVVADGAGEIIITAPPSVTDKDTVKEYRVGIVTIKDEQRLREVLNNNSFINQLLSKLGLAELFYKAFYTNKLYSSLTYLQIENTSEEIMSLQNITMAFKNLIKERQEAFTLFQNDVDAYYENLGKTLFEHVNLWWDKKILPQEYYAGDDNILSKQEFRKMIDDAIISLSLKANTSMPVTGVSGQILSLEQYLRTQMLMNSKLIYIQNLKNAVSNMNKGISLSIGKLNRPVFIHEKNSIEALIALPEKKRSSSR